MGMVSPLVVANLDSSAETSGKRAGLVYAISTTGGITFTFLFGFYVIPNFGLIVPSIITGFVLGIIPAILIFKNGWKKPGVFMIALLFTVGYHAWQKRLTEHYGTIVPGPSRKFDLPQSEASKFTAMFAQQDSIKSDILKFMENYDVLITPVRSIPVPPIGDPDQIGALPGSSFTAIYNVTGYLAGVVRGGHSDDGLPIGVQVVGQPWMEHVVLAVMKFLEQELEGYQRPPL